MTDTAQRGEFRYGKAVPERTAPRAGARGHRRANPKVSRPVLRRRSIRRRDAFGARHEVDPCTATVLVGPRGDARAFPPDQRPTAGDLLRAAGGVLYEVDTSLHHDGVIFDLPARGDGFAFYARVDIEWRVSDPERVVRDRIDDVIRALVPTLRRAMATVTRAREIEQVEEAERAALDIVSTPEIGARYGLDCTFWVRLSTDRTTVEHAAAKRSLDHEFELEERGQRNREVRATNEHALLARKVDAYRAYMQGGLLDQAALQLAKNPGDSAAVVELLRAERRDERQQAVDFITKLIESDAIDRWQIDDTARGALRWLQESVENVIRPSSQPLVPGGSPSAVDAAERPPQISGTPDNLPESRRDDPV